MYKTNKVTGTVEIVLYKSPAVKKEACVKFLNGMYQKHRCGFVRN